MADSYIHLAIASLQVTVNEFVDPDGYPRKSADAGGRQLSVWGNPVRYGYGRLKDTQQIFQFTAVLSQVQSRILSNMYLYQKDLLDRKQPNYGIQLTDTVNEFRELGAVRTRAKAPAPFDTETVSGGVLCYYARFSVEFTAEPAVIDTWTHAELGRSEVVVCTLEELGQKVAP